METARAHILMPILLKEKLDQQIPRGIRSDFCSAAVEMALDALEEHGPAFLGLMLAGEIAFRPNPRIGQNLVTSTKEVKDEKRNSSTTDR